jgi:hypothetical protein
MEGRQGGAGQGSKDLVVVVVVVVVCVGGKRAK